MRLELTHWLQLPHLNERRPTFGINDSNLVSVADVQPIYSIPSTADMVKTVDLFYSPSQVSNKYQTPNLTVVWKNCTPISWKPRNCEPLESFVEVTFKCRAFKTDLPFSETFKRLLRALKLDHVPRRGQSATLTMINCPEECMAMVTMETICWIKTLRGYNDGFWDISRSYDLNARGSLTKRASHPVSCTKHP